MKLSEKNYKRIVIKVGSSLMFGQEAQAECFSPAVAQIIAQVSDLINKGHEVIIVSSGAIACGLRKLKMKSRPKELSSLQATAAVGQHFLMSQYRKFFEAKGLECAQVLLTWEDFDERKRYLNAKNTLQKLIELGVVPVVNENDTISTDEIKFGDNDRLSALVAALVGADLLIILSDVDGLLDKDKKTLIRIVDEITPQIKAFACPTDKHTCVGGMITKLDAAKIAVVSGIPCVIANGKKEKVILNSVDNPVEGGTLFISKKSLNEKERWIAFGTKSKGKVIVDDGAKAALGNNKSLLSVGVVGVHGAFNSGDIVSVTDRQGNEFARGKVSITSKQAEEVKGRRFEKEVMHRDNIVIL